jgi:cyclophilin family peptidyl-prolyl cis-trans isomerase
VLAQLKDEFSDDVRIVFRQFPLISIHSKAAISAQASEAAGNQKKFWEMHDVLFEKQSEWAGLSEDGFQEWAADQAEVLGLDVEQFLEDMNSEEIASRINKAYEENARLGIPGTPFVAVNGQPVGNSNSYEALKTIIEANLMDMKLYDECPEQIIEEGKNYRAIIETEKGEFELELHAQQAPVAVNNFVFLSEEGWYDGVTFHRVLPDFVAQSGDPSGTGMGSPGYNFDNEISEDLKFDKPGVVGMANSGPDTNGSQFFITYKSVPQLDGGYTIFGQVVSGMDVVESLTPRDPSQSANLPPGDKIVSITIVSD